MNGQQVHERMLHTSYYMTQQSHFQIYFKRKEKQDLEEISALLSFTARLVTVSKLWKQPKYLSMDAHCVHKQDVGRTHPVGRNTSQP